MADKTVWRINEYSLYNDLEINQFQREGLYCASGTCAIYTVGVEYFRLVSEYSNGDTNYRCLVLGWYMYLRSAITT